MYSTCVWSTFEIVSHRQPKLKSKSPPTKTSLPHFASSHCVLGLMQNDVGKTAADTTQVKWHAPFFNYGFLFFFFFCGKRRSFDVEVNQRSGGTWSRQYSVHFLRHPSNQTPQCTVKTRLCSGIYTLNTWLFRYKVFPSTMAWQINCLSEL